MTIQLPPNSTGTVLGSRTVPREGERQIVIVNDRGQPGNHAGSRADAAGEVLFIEDFRHPVTSFWNDGVGGATRDNSMTFAGYPTMRLDPQAQVCTAVLVSAVAGLTATAVGSGGTFTAGTYFWKITATNLVGETLGSNEATATIVTNGSANLSWTASTTGALGYNVYRATTSGAEFLVASGITGTTYTDTGTAVGVAIPTSPTTKSPSRTAATSGVVAKRRIIDGFTGKFGLECWFRFSSTGWSNDAYPILAIYNRDTASAWHGRIWLNPMGNNTPMAVWILDGAATAAANASPLTGNNVVWRKVQTSPVQTGTGQHSFLPSTGSLDRAGGWHHVKLIMDMANKKYVSVALDGQPTIDLSAYNMDQTTSTGAAMMHFSIEAASASSVLHYMNIARVIGTIEQ